MHIQLKDLSKRYMKRWIFKDLNNSFAPNNIYGITGINGSGKSTLIKVISGYLTHSAGEISYRVHGQDISRDDVYKHLSVAAPYLELDLDFTLKEQISFYQKFKPFISSFDIKSTLTEIGLIEHYNKPIRQFSSGMQQRVQLILCLFSDVSCMLLDEPTSFLDEDGKAWFYKMLSALSQDRTVIMASNDAEDIAVCESLIKL